MLLVKMVRKLLELFMNNLIKKNLYSLLLISILLLSFFLRFYKLGINPPSLDWDEASIGYNAYSVLKTGADEYGNKFPLSFRSFEDYKPPVYFYLDVLSIRFFGLNEVGVRFPSALLGFLSVIVIYFLTKEIFDKKIALLSAFFFGISPWSLQFSRAAFEGNVGLFFFLLAFFLALKSIKQPALSILATISFVLSIYSYHSFVLIVPLFICLLLFLFFKQIISNKKYFIFSILFFLILIIPVLSSFVSLNGSGSRLSMVSIFSAGETLNPSIKELEYDRLHNDKIGALLDNRRIVYFLALAKGYFDHWNPDFLFFHGDGGGQHHSVNMGMLYLWDLPFILIGAYSLFKNRTRKSLAIFLLFLIAPLPSAVSTGTPHPVRAIAMAPVFSIFTALGVYEIFNKSGKTKNMIILPIIILLFIVNFAYYLHQYYVFTPLEASNWWQYGNKEAVLQAKDLDKKYQKIIFTYFYDQPYIYYLFYNKIDPSWYQKNWNKEGSIERMRRVIGKYEFRKIDYGSDSKKKDILLIGSPGEIPENAPGLIKTIYFLNGSVSYRILGT